MDTQELLKILACPQCHGDLELTENGKKGFLCPVCQKVYPIEDDIPIMIIEEAIPLADWQQEGEA